MKQSNKLKGWIYVISNKAMPGLVKIGYSTKDPKLRAEELDHTGSPHPYFVEYEMLIEEPFQIEQQIHKILKCDHEGKEWFRCSVEAAIIAIKKIADKSIIYEKVITSLPRDKKQDYGSSATKNTDEFVIPAEMRIDHGPGYRVYYLRHERSVIILLAGGDKSTQARDIKTALRLARNL